MGFFDKIFSGLTKTRTNMEELEELFKNYKFESDDFYEELEDSARHVRHRRGDDRQGH